MKSDVIRVSSTEDRTEEVLNQADQVAAYQNLSHKSALHLRLLAEEMMSMVRAITGDVNGDFWIENKGPQYELHLRVRTAMNFQKREQLLSVSTSGKNEAHRGFMGRIRAFFEPLEGAPLLFDLGMDGIHTEGVWSMSAYQEQLQECVKENREGAAQAWDELEKSVVAHIADDVKVSINGFDVEMTVLKELK